MTPDDIIDEISNIRIKNNDLWMDILRLAYRLDPNQTRNILHGIQENDRDIERWLAKL